MRQSISKFKFDNYPGEKGENFWPTLKAAGIVEGNYRATQQYVELGFFENGRASKNGIEFDTFYIIDPQGKLLIENALRGQRDQSFPMTTTEYLKRRGVAGKLSSTYYGRLIAAGICHKDPMDGQRYVAADYVDRGLFANRWVEKEGKRFIANDVLNEEAVAVLDSALGFGKTPKLEVADTRQFVPYADYMRYFDKFPGYNREKLEKEGILARDPAFKLLQTKDWLQSNIITVNGKELHILSVDINSKDAKEFLNAIQ